MKKFGLIRLMKIIAILSTISIICFWYIDDIGREVPEVSGTSRKAVVYLDKALWLMEHRYLHAGSADWSTIRHTAFKSIEGAQSPQDTFPAIRKALSALNDWHCFLETSPSANFLSKNDPTDQSFKIEFPSGEMLPEQIAYLYIPEYLGKGWGALYQLNDKNGRDFVEQTRNLLKNFDMQNPKGWIIDLRWNLGGSMWPMLDGLAPLIGEGLIHTIEMPQFNRRVETWVKESRANSGTPSVLTGAGWLGPENLVLLNSQKPLVVLIGPNTASAGEAVAVSFRGRPKTYFVGEQSGGLTTSTQGFTLGSGAKLYLTIGNLSDREGKIYGGKIAPDEIAYDWKTGVSSKAISAASKWILKN